MTLQQFLNMSDKDVDQFAKKFANDAVWKLYGAQIIVLAVFFVGFLLLALIPFFT